MSKIYETNKSENILLLSDFPPCKNSFFGIHISKLIRFLLEEKKNIFCFCISDLSINYNFFEDIKNNINFKIVATPKADSKYFKTINYNFRFNIIKHSLLNYVKKNNITKIWCPINSETSILMLTSLYDKIKIPYVVQLPDKTDIFLKNSSDNLSYNNDLFSKFTNILKNCSCCLVTSAEAENYYQNKYSIKCINIEDTPNIRQNFFEAFSIPYSGEKLNILEINNIDLLGRRFNGYDLMEEINNHTNCTANQLVTYKTSDNKHVIPIYKNENQLHKEWQLLYHEKNLLSVHSQLSIASGMIENNDYFQNADVVHYHLIHNTKISLFSLIDLCANKPSVLTIHDPWIFTGRCVHPQECTKWKTGCNDCEYLDSLFPFKEDNCNSLWRLKEQIYKSLDIDIIVTTPFMKKMLEESPLTKHFKHVHLIPFGLDLKKFGNTISKEDARQKLKIPSDDIVLFFRSQRAMKGTEYIIEALKLLNSEKHITLITCSEKNVLDELKNKYTIIDLGDIEDEEIIMAYNACDIFLMPSKGESFGLMAIEAMACARPVVIFDNSALPYVTFAPDCGVLVENKNSSKLMEAIKMLIDNPNERIRRGLLGRKLAEENYNIDVYHQKILEVYHKAYERQKNKNKPILNDEINYEILDVQLLSNKLNYIYKKLFPLDHFTLNNDNSSINFDNNYKTDYSLIDIQNLIKQFNKKIYANTCKIPPTRYKSKIYVKFNEIYSLYVNDRPELLKRIKKPLYKNKLIYRICRSLYRFIKSIKHIIFRAKH